MTFQPIISSSKDVNLQVEDPTPESDDSAILSFASTTIDVSQGLEKIDSGPNDIYIVLYINRGEGMCRVKFINRKLNLEPYEVLSMLIRHVQYELPSKDRLNAEDLLLCKEGGIYFTFLAKDHRAYRILVARKREGENYTNNLKSYLDFFLRPW